VTVGDIIKIKKELKKAAAAAKSERTVKAPATASGLSSPQSASNPSAQPTSKPPPPSINRSAKPSNAKSSMVSSAEKEEAERLAAVKHMDIIDAIAQKKKDRWRSQELKKNTIIAKAEEAKRMELEQAKHDEDRRKWEEQKRIVQEKKMEEEKRIEKRKADEDQPAQSFVQLEKPPMKKAKLAELMKHRGNQGDQGDSSKPDRPIFTLKMATDTISLPRQDGTLASLMAKDPQLRKALTRGDLSSTGAREVAMKTRITSSPVPAASLSTLPTQPTIHQVTMPSADTLKRLKEANKATARKSKGQATGERVTTFGPLEGAKKLKDLDGQVHNKKSGKSSLSKDVQGEFEEGSSTGGKRKRH